MPHTLARLRFADRVTVIVARLTTGLGRRSRLTQRLDSFSQGLPARAILLGANLGLPAAGIDSGRRMLIDHAGKTCTRMRVPPNTTNEWEALPEILVKSQSPRTDRDECACPWRISLRALSAFRSATAPITGQSTRIQHKGANSLHWC